MDFICIDTEDDSAELMKAGLSGFDKKVTQIAALTGSGESFYNRGNAKEFKKWLLQRPELSIYALNIQYDLGNLFPDTLDELDITMVGGRLIKAIWKERVFLDVYNLYQLSVANLAKYFGLEKLEFSADSREYVFRDVEIIHKAVSFAWEFCARIGIGKAPATIAGAAIKTWKQWGGVNNHDSEPISREALYGGRVELFKGRNATKNICYTDINSLYPSMMTKEFPETMESQTDFVSYGVADVLINQPETDLPVLPWRNEDDEILYPWGTFRGTWTIAEIQKAIDNGAKLEKVYAISGCNNGVKPYQEFVERIYKLRKTCDNKAESLFYKLLMNNLYGRLGISGVISRSVYKEKDDDERGINYGDKVLVDYSMPLAEETNWSHAAHVTAYGRLTLLDYMERIGAAAMIYCDTDSTIFDTGTAKKIPFQVSMELGEMKLEGWERSCEVYAPKTYAFGEQYKAKGVPRRLARDFIETHRVEFALPFKMREAVRFYDDDNRKQLSVWRKVEKVWQTDYKKKIMRNGRFFPCQIIEKGAD
jgi:hypothetical protein